MAESETECDTPGLDTLGSECVIAHSQVDLHYAAETEIMTEEKRGLELEIHGADLAKIEGLTAVACVDAMVTETDHDYVTKMDHHGEIQCFTMGGEGKGEALLGEVLLKTETEHMVKVESDHVGGELTVESENGVVIHEAHGLQCNECGEIFGSMADLHLHFEIHKATNPYICVHCGESFAVESSLKQHMKIHMKEKAYATTGVEMVGKGVIDTFNLKSHQMIHSPEKPHRCSECGKSFAAAITLREHMKMHSEDKPYKCTQCRKSFIRRRHLKKHQELHAREKPFTCSQCGKGFTTSSNLKQHQRTHAGDKPHRCTQCGKCFAAASTLREHQRIHSGEKPYKCNQCRKSFVRKRHLKKHQQVHSGGKPYSCSQCDKSFNHSSSLSRHHKVHLEARIYSSPPQGKAFSYGSTMKQQARLHQGGGRGAGDKPYSCNHCDKGFNHSSSLSRHQRVHSEGKSYTCGHCGKRFNHSSSLSRHQRVHQEEKQVQVQQQVVVQQQYSAVPSTKGFPHTTILKQRILASEKPYRCSQCGKGFNHSSSLSRHHRIHIDQ
ncbi:zinc finger protein 883-like [Oncorhynchus nerka]|uniref:zinc finger protein 883-like n=1 Tax=Oncorhynchus nerka TaxID=8023 RepID=UPI0011324E69|nr:zinc finger protein 883-like [Oncorhynchus nerka]XP_029496167.1 zinc finger protein 883-like [Oncorhynchus nerka]